MLHILRKGRKEGVSTNWDNESQDVRKVDDLQHAAKALSPYGLNFQTSVKATDTGVGGGLLDTDAKNVGKVREKVYVKNYRGVLTPALAAEATPKNGGGKGKEKPSENRPSELSNYVPVSSNASIQRAASHSRLWARSFSHALTHTRFDKRTPTHPH